MKRRMTIEYLKCRADLNFEVDFGVTTPLVRLRPSGILCYSENGSFSSTISFFKSGMRLGFGKIPENCMWHLTLILYNTAGSRYQR